MSGNRKTWTTFAKEIPPLNRKILIALAFGKDDNITFKVFYSFVHKPYNLNKKYNPDYYFFLDECNEEIEIKKDYFWLNPFEDLEKLTINSTSDKDNSPDE